MIRLLISSSSFPIRLDDGLPRFVYDLADALAEHCEVVVLVPDAPGAARQERMGRVEVRRFTYLRPRRWQSLAYGHGMRENLRRSFVCRLQPLPYLWSQAMEIRALARQREIDAVNSHWMVPQGLSTALARGPGCRFRHVLSIHAADIYMLRRVPLGRAIARFIVGRTDRIFAPGSHVRDSLDQLLGRPCEATILPMGVQVDMFRTGPGLSPEEIPFADGYLLFFGRLVEKKGVTYLLQAMPRILEHHPGVGLIIVGYGPLEGDLRREADRLGIGSAVVFAGRQPHAEIGRYLRSSRIAVVPSIIDRRGETEGMPTVVLEAMAGGARVVASAVDGIPDIVRHGENGWLCREKDPGDLAEKILIALADKGPSTVVRAAEQTAEQLAWPKVAGRYLEVIEQLVRSGQEVPPEP